MCAAAVAVAGFSRMSSSPHSLSLCSINEGRLLTFAEEKIGIHPVHTSMSVPYKQGRLLIFPEEKIWNIRLPVQIMCDCMISVALVVKARLALTISGQKKREEIQHV